MKTNYYSKLKLKLYLQKYINHFVSPFKSSTAQLSLIYSTHEDVKPSDYLYTICLEAAQNAKKIDVSEISFREKTGQKWVDIFPGEHYKLLGSLMQVLKPKVVIEIGTFLGQSSLVIQKYLPENAILYTFDVIRWKEFRDSCFVPDDFDKGNLIQFTDDLTTEKGFARHKGLLESADFIFVDALKDGIQEKKFLEKFIQAKLKDDCIIMFDDIRVWNMIKIWKEIERPKMDMTSFGHWSGTGLVHWNG